MTRLYGVRHHGPGSARSLRDALAEQRPVGGRDLIGTLVAGVETERRIGTAVSPYYEIGWISLLASTSRGPCRHIV